MPALNLLDAVLLAMLHHDTAHALAMRPLKGALLSGKVKLDVIRQSCEESGHLSVELWEFISPLVLEALVKREDKDEQQAAATLVSIHAKMMGSARPYFTRALLQCGTPACARAVEDVFASVYFVSLPICCNLKRAGINAPVPYSSSHVPPTDDEVSVLSGDLGLLNAATHVRRAALVSLATKPECR